MAADLLFSRPLASNGALVFGDESDAPINRDVTLSAQYSLPELSGTIWISGGFSLSAQYSLPELSGTIGLAYVSNTSRPEICNVAVRWEDAKREATRIVDTWQNAIPRLAPTDVSWQQARPASAQTSVKWQDSPRARTTLRVLFASANRLQTKLIGRFENSWHVRSQVRSLFEQAVRSDSELQVTFANMLHLRDWRMQHFDAAARQSNGLVDRAVDALRAAAHLRVIFQQAIHAPPGMYIPVSVIPTGTCYTPSAALLFEAERADHGHLVFICERHTAPPEPGATVVVPIRKVYVVVNNITLHRVDTGAELHAHGFSMSLDHQSWTWSWSASLHHDAAAHLGRDGQGDPAELAVVVNGVQFRLRLERLGRDRRFNPTRWAVSGRGKAAVLDALYAPSLSFGSASDRTAQQLMNEGLTINGVGIGWSVDWGLTDWLVPGGAWALQGSYIEAVNDIAAAAGGYVQPHPTDAVLRILPRYPAAPWNWADITPDFEIPADAAEVEGTEYVDRPAYNRVFVGGVGAGVFGPFTRAGTAGNVIAPQVTHPLITHADAHRQRGLAEISDTGRQEHITLTMQVLPETGVITPGQFVRYLGDKTVMGIVRSTSIDWSRPKLRQNIGIETHA